MIEFKNKIVLITGASSGIGQASAVEFAKHGAKLILAARRKDRLDELASKLVNEHKAEVLTLELDVRNQKDVQKAIDGLPAEWANIDILLNNAGLSRGLEKIQEGVIQNWEEMIDTNIKGLLYVTRAVMPGMVKRNSGHIVNIGSIAGHEVYPGGNVYCATKHAVKALNKAMRMDAFGTNIRVSSIDPGMAETEFSLVRFRGDSEKAKKVYQGTRPLQAEDIAQAVVWSCTRPSHVNIEDMIITATDQASATMVNRKQ
ncbi:MAG: SDR family oxidoreductase [Candidatus Edwardsbacteria bacterium]|nr:SDR family oxidoreductase [Candidatus Edwardsbacteria bacterium]MBU1576360.1 SDR family oxidoreductase [Candidatus Edwardsbacteria bacterium]MBU2462772.1 SDR family oxidoreductase [Candidatus Edwardsbacteria bacterium]MBU2593537.1 SDR family oxidoreductase [Candidatus Edwardsbacteria bacterium]